MTTEPTTWQRRLLDERDELTMRVTRLRAFLAFPPAMSISQQDADLLNLQLKIMGSYLAVLNIRANKLTIRDLEG